MTNKSPVLITISILIQISLVSSKPFQTENNRNSNLVYNEYPPLIWIFMGLPGDKSHEQQYAGTITQLIYAFNNHFNIPKQDITVLFGKGNVNSWKECNAINISNELERIYELSHKSRPIWIFFLGHSNSTPNGTNYNISGVDMSAAEIGKNLSRIKKETAVAIFITTSAGEKYLKELSSKGRVVVCAAETEDRDNETQFPHSMAEVLNDPDSDINRDGYLSVLELFQRTKQRVETFYKNKGLIQMEKALLDGNGDYYGTMRPSDEDAQLANQFRLKYK